MGKATTTAQGTTGSTPRKGKALPPYQVHTAPHPAQPVAAQVAMGATPAQAKQAVAMLAAYKAAVAKGCPVVVAGSVAASVAAGQPLAQALAAATGTGKGKLRASMGGTQAAMWQVWCKVPPLAQGKLLALHANPAALAKLCGTQARNYGGNQPWHNLMAALCLTQGTVRAAAAAWHGHQGAMATVTHRAKVGTAAKGSTPSTRSRTAGTARKRAPRKPSPVATTHTAPTAPSGPVPTTAA